MRKLKIHGSNVTDIGGHFLSYCYRLTTLDLKSFSNVRRIGIDFLFHCSGLRELDLRPLSNVTGIGHYFLSRCSGLTTLDLTPLSNVTRIDSFFLSGCAGLTTLDLRPLSNVTGIGDYFLSHCSGLTRATVTVPTNWRFVYRLPENLIPRREMARSEMGRVLPPQDDFSVAQTQSLLGRVDPMDDSQTRAENLRVYQAQQAQAEVLRNSPEEESVHEESISEKISSEELRIITNVAREAHRRDINTFDEFYRLYETRANAARKTPLDKVTAKKVLDEQGMLDAFRDPPESSEE